jgi:hypothetical protein
MSSKETIELGGPLTSRWLRALMKFSPSDPVPPMQTAEQETPYPCYSVSNSLSLNANAPASRKGPIGRCIYCGVTEFEPGSNLPLSEEHVVPEGLGARLILLEASCKSCAERINVFETNMLRTLLLAPRRQMGIRGKKRKRDEKDYPVTTVVGDKDVVLRLPLAIHPTMLFLPILNAPGALCGRSPNKTGLQGLSILELNCLEKNARGQKIASPTLDTAQFCQLLAKIAHGYAVTCFGLDGFKPVLVDLILRKLGKENWIDCYHWVGGNPMEYAPNNTLHLLGWGLGLVEGVNYLVAAIRLFANLESPIFHVVVGTPSSSLRLTVSPSAGESLGYQP